MRSAAILKLKGQRLKAGQCCFRMPFMSSFQMPAFERLMFVRERKLVNGRDGRWNAVGELERQYPPALPLTVTDFMSLLAQMNFA